MHTRLQQQLLETILSKYAKKATAVEELSQILAIGKDAVYRRLRGDTLLTPDELGLLSRQFKISLDALVFENTDTVFFTFNRFSKTSKNFEEFLWNFLEEMERASKLPDYRFYYASAELPLFQSMFVPELIAFKMFIWGRTVLDFGFIQEASFSFDLIPLPLMQLTEKMLSIYIRLPSTELWSQNIIDNTLNQFEYHLSSGSFKRPEDALLLCDKLSELIDHMQLMARHGRKMALGATPSETSGSSFDLYHNEMVHTNNTILATTTTGNVLYTTLSNPNFLKSSDPQICEFMEDWFQKVIVKSNSISMQSERSREWFFNRLRKKIERSRHRMEMEMGG
ncbi:MAG: hypothetical protein AAFV95_21595 [Bacteroidota bacterium]